MDYCDVYQTLILTAPIHVEYFLGNYSYHGRCFEGCVTWVCTFCKLDYDI